MKFEEKMVASWFKVDGVEYSVEENVKVIGEYCIIHGLWRGYDERVVE